MFHIKIFVVLDCIAQQEVGPSAVTSLSSNSWAAICRHHLLFKISVLLSFPQKLMKYLNFRLLTPFIIFCNGSASLAPFQNICASQFSWNICTCSINCNILYRNICTCSVPQIPLPNNFTSQFSTNWNICTWFVFKANILLIFHGGD